MLDKAKATVGLATDRAHVLREAIMCCRKGGTVSIPGVYIGFPDKIPMGAAMNKALTFKMGQTHVPKYHKLLLQKIEAGEIDPSFVITHRVPLEEGPAAYKTFRDKKDDCIKVVLKPDEGHAKHARDRTSRLSRAIKPQDQPRGSMDAQTVHRQAFDPAGCPKTAARAIAASVMPRRGEVEQVDLELALRGFICRGRERGVKLDLGGACRTPRRSTCPAASWSEVHTPEGTCRMLQSGSMCSRSVYVATPAIDVRQSVAFCDNSRIVRTSAQIAAPAELLDLAITERTSMSASVGFGTSLATGAAIPRDLDLLAAARRDPEAGEGASLPRTRQRNP